MVVTGAGAIIKNCISYWNSGNGFKLGAGNSIYNCDAYRNSGTGILLSGAGNCRNNIGTNNGGSNYNLAAVVQGKNCTFHGGVADKFGDSDVVYGGSDLYQYSSTSASFLSLSSSSPCINAGDSLAGIVTKDIWGGLVHYQTRWRRTGNGTWGRMRCRLGECGCTISR